MVGPEVLARRGPAGARCCAYRAECCAAGRAKPGCGPLARQFGDHAGMLSGDTWYVLLWKAALCLPRVVDFSDAVCVAHTCTVDLILATARSWQLPNGKTASRWRALQGAQWEFAMVSERLRKHEVRTILHAKDRGGPTFRGAGHVMSLHDLIASHGQVETNAKHSADV